MEFREVLMTEIGEVAKLHNELAYFIQKETKDEYWDFVILSEENISKHLENFIGNSERKIYIAKTNEKIVGFIAGEVMQCHLPISSVNKIGYISGAFVLPDFRGKKVMSSLEKLIVDYFKQRGLKFTELNFLTKNSLAKKTWESMGYKTFREQARKEI
jgi:ribosomal protein S18 acetylase RimI-like enzyme